MPEVAEQVAQAEVPEDFAFKGGPYDGQLLSEVGKTEEGREWLRATFFPKQQADLAVVVEENGQRIMRLSPHPGQRKALESKARFVAVIAGSQAGKSVTGPVWLFNEMKAKGPGDYLVVSPTFTLLELKALPAFIKFFDKQMGLGKYLQTPVRRFIMSEEGETLLFGKYDAANPTTVYFAYAEDPESLESMTIKAAWLDEAGQKKFKLGSWQAILRRLAVNRGRALITTTPYDFGWLKCLAWNARVAYPDGTRRLITDVKVGDMVLSLDQSNRLTSSPVTRVWKRGVKPIVRVKTQSGRTIDCTENHRFLTEHGWKPLCEIPEGERIAVARNLPFGKQMENRARILGWVIGDGSITGRHIRLALGEDESREDALRCLPSGVRLVRYAKVDYGISTGSAGRFRPNPLMQWFREIGAWGCDAHTKFVPDCVFGWTETAIAEFIGGYFSADGTAGHRRISACSVSHRLALDIQDLLLRLGILSSIVVARKFHAYHIRVTHRRSLQRFSEIIRMIPRKQKLALAASAEQQHSEARVGNNDRTPIGNGEWASRQLVGCQDDVYWERIASIEPRSAQPTYDLEVAGTHNFVANTLYVHNSQIFDRWKTEKEKREAEGATGPPEYDVINFKSTENPTFPQEEYDRAKLTMPAWQHALFYDGEFRRAAGLIYDCFHPETHAIPRFKIPSHWDRLCGLDFGGVNTVAVLLAEKPNTNELYIYRVYKAGGRTGLEHSYHIQQGEPGFRICSGGARSEGQWRQEFRRGGTIKGIEVPGLMVRKPLIADVKLGISRVYGAFARGEIYIFDDLDDLLEELETYSWELDQNQHPTGEIDDKSTYHGADALRYIISNVRGPDYEADTPLSAGMRGARDEAELMIDEDARRAMALQVIADKKSFEDARYREAEALDRERQRNPYDPSWYR